MIAKEGFDVFGSDSAEEGIKLYSRMLENWKTNANIRIGNMLALPHEDNYFDAVVDVVSTQHLAFSQHPKVYNEVKRVLKSGGYFFSYHLGNKSFSYRYGGGKLIDNSQLIMFKIQMHR